MIYVFGFVLVTALAVLAFIDYRTHILPDKYTLPLIAIGLAFAIEFGDLRDALLGMGLGYLGFVALELAYKQIRGRDGLGRGDAKLLAAGGAWCSWIGLPFIILIGSASGLLHALLLSSKSKDEPTELPFGPHLALGIFMTWLALFVLT
ncbi:MAG: prepilin peptidase [Acidimicrobiales bacterium]|nr:prepilin peptidase [Hyphomonadaceae bacterium]RZV36688.1 MAG: prepilin peptidase [Acidimicrobiales bacterium]